MVWLTAAALTPKALAAPTIEPDSTTLIKLAIAANRFIDGLPEGIDS